MKRVLDCDVVSIYVAVNVRKFPSGWGKIQAAERWLKIDTENSMDRASKQQVSLKETDNGFHNQNQEKQLKFGGHLFRKKWYWGQDR